MSIDVRPETPEDAGPVRRIVVAAFRYGPGPREIPPGEEPIEGGLLDGLRADPGAIDSGWIVEADGEPVAHALVVNLTVGGTPALGLGMLATLPEHQKRGHGAKAVYAVIGALLERGEPLLIVFGSPQYYGRFGFVPAPVVGISHPSYPSPYLQALALQTPFPRGEVAYPRPYADLDA
jgi:putative acetyltransferase